MNKILAYFGFEPMTWKEILTVILVESIALTLFVYYFLFIY